jgi:hypothetical protein
VKDWYPGMEVVCINASDIRNWARLYSDKLVRGKTYKLRHIRLSDKPAICLIAVCLEEIVGKLRESDGQETAFYGLRFRPAQKPKTGMEILTAALKSATVKNGDGEKVKEREREKIE